MFTKMDMFWWVTQLKPKNERRVTRQWPQMPATKNYFNFLCALCTDSIKWMHNRDTTPNHPPACLISKIASQSLMKFGTGQDFTLKIVKKIEF
jgi:hypothetical protein